VALEKQFVGQMAYAVPLLRLLASLPGGGAERKQVLALFEERYGHRIPEEHRAPGHHARPIWRTHVVWCRQHLKAYGFVDASKFGIWQIAEPGRAWLAQHPDAARITGVPKTKAQPAGRPLPPRDASPPGMSLEMLEQTRRSMPAEEFRRVWGASYDRLLAQERAKETTAASREEIGRRACARIDEIRAFLEGKNAGFPSGETLCDWIHFCYALELHREAAALLHYVPEGDVESVVYRRARRVAEVCRSRLSG